MHRAIAAAALCLCLAAPAGAVTVEQIPDPRPGGWTVDLTGSVDTETIRALNRVCNDVKARTGGEMMVVVVGSIDGADSRDFATRLGNAWGIGDREADNGLLILAALDDRVAEIALGTGIDRPETRQASDEIMQGEMVPRFREGDAPGALLHGARAAARRIFRVPSEAPAAVVPQSKPAPAPRTVRRRASEPDDSAPGWLWLLLGGGAAGIAGLGFLKYVPPSCRECRSRMVKLSEAGDDLHLEPTEQMEEQIRSVDYDVWMCNGCGNVVKRRWPNFFSGYGTCPACRARTKSSVSTTLRQADEWTEGLVEVTEACVNCDYRHRYTRSIPRHAPSASSSSSGISSSSSSSSSSGGSSGGGGSFSGGGSSGRW